MDRAYLLAEVVSIADYEIVPDADEAWIDVKRRLYLSHPPCEAVLVIEQGRVEVRVDVRTKDGWVSSRLTGLAEQLVLAGFGLRCPVADLYEGTPLQPRRVRARRT